MSAAMLQNKAGKWLASSPDTIAAAAATKPEVSPTNFSIVDAAGASSWPISGFSWVLVYKKPGDPGRAKLVYNVLAWLIGPEGQSNAKSVDYVPLPSNIQSSSLATLKQMQH